MILMLLALGVQMVFAQQKTVSGTLSDENGLPLPGATVIISGTSSGTSTDFDGKYQLAANVGDVLEISYVGYTTQSVNVGASNFYNIVMQSDNTLDEVVIVGYGTTTKKSFAGTATNIKAENIESKNFSNITQAISGEVAGVSVINTSGQPGTIGTVRIRGYGSPLGNRNPLYVVDGVAFGYNFDLNSLNPADIKTTTILKDATATAIYGSRGANGVVLITTKNGSQNKDAVIGVEFKTGVNQQLIPRYDVISSPEQYIGLVWEGLFNRGVTTNEADPIEFANDRLLGANGIGDGYNMWNVDSAADLIDPQTRFVKPGVTRLFNPERYADEAFGTGIRNEVNLSVNGGGEKTRYFASLGYLNDEGYSINSDYNRYTLRLNTNSDLKNWIKVGVNIGYAYSESTNNGQIQGSENLFEFADKMAPIYPVYARFPGTGDLIPDTVYGGYQYDYGSPTGDLNGFTRSRPNANLLNPIGSANLDFDGRTTNALNGSIFAHINILPSLKFETTYGGQYSFEKRQIVSNHVYGTGRNSNGTLSLIDRIRWTRTFTNLLRFTKDYDNHNIEVIAAHETYENGLSQSRQFKKDVIVPGLYNLSNYSLSESPSDGYVDNSGIESIFGQVNYNYFNKYYLTASLRRDGSSRFVNNKWGTFGSVGLAWLTSAEDFMQDSIFTYLKLKASYGVTGDQNGVSTSRGFTVYDSDFVGGGLSLSENRPGYADLTWEKSKMVQGGVETSIGNRLDINIDYYNKLTDNLFFNQRVGPSSGFSSILVNDGKIINAGLEFELVGDVIKTDDFKLTVSVNGEILKNEFKQMPIDPSTEAAKIIDTGSSRDGSYAYAEGRSQFDFYMREWAGVNQTNGAPMWYQYYDDRNNNGELDAGDISDSDSWADPNGGTNTSSTLFEYKKLVSDANIKRTTTADYREATEVFLNKSFIPDLRGAFRVSASYKSFNFSTQFTYSLGGYAYDSQYAELMSDRFGAAGNNYHKDILERWQEEGDSTNVPLLSDNAVINATSTSSRFITSTDYIGLNNARIGYTLNDKFTNNLGLEGVNLWVAGDNLFIQTKRKGFNPSVREVGSSQRRIYAPATTITIGAKINF
jgi:TonB-linked SusC/RagA family outer membrane protein